MGCDVGDSRLNNKTGQVAHSGEQVCVAMIVSEVAWHPQVEVQNEKWAHDGPQENKLFALTSILVGQHAMREHTNPRGDVAVHL